MNVSKDNLRNALFASEMEARGITVGTVSSRLIVTFQVLKQRLRLNFQKVIHTTGHEYLNSWY